MAKWPVYVVTRTIRVRARDERAAQESIYSICSGDAQNFGWAVIEDEGTRVEVISEKLEEAFVRIRKGPYDQDLEGK